MKNAHMDTIGDWRSTTLLSVDYKILAKVVTLWVRDVVRKFVCKEHIGFINWMFILDIVISTLDAIEWAREFGQQSLFLKIDYDRAYDWVE